MKIIRVDMATGSIRNEEMEPAFTGIGGRGLTSFIINEEVPPTCDPLGPENKLIIAPGFLSGTPLVNTSRLSIGAKSPLTGGIRRAMWAAPLPPIWQILVFRPSLWKESPQTIKASS